jgi:hypothetical protein
MVSTGGVEWRPSLGLAAVKIDLQKTLSHLQKNDQPQDKDQI